MRSLPPKPDENRDTTGTGNPTPLYYQAEDDLLDTMNGADPVRQAWRMGHITDPQAIINVNRAEQRQARILQVVQVNRDVAE